MKQILTLPNILTGLRFALVPVLIILFSIKQTFTIEMVSFWVFTFAALTDLADGWAARKYKIETVLGKLMDPLADKALVSTALIMLIPLGRMPAWVCLLIICREMIVTGFRGLAASTGKVVAAICHAGWMLASAEVLEGKTVTSFFAIKDDLIHAGATWVDQEVVVDGNLITSRTPDDLPAFMRAIIEALK